MLMWVNINVNEKQYIQLKDQLGEYLRADPLQKVREYTKNNDRDRSKQSKQLVFRREAIRWEYEQSWVEYL